ncbi:hypothetical protein CALVIDRAFT_532199 [Calocera viscosa TUFC12733]|uniref:Uncharacterized protein n=1 Tax=Calocera viscosa (strain TUFC12733) TaxID=1330018 RepID=A0A167RZA2_CALVF|nr:hypothetical protein CALVIDRAFT_532199 [Calocera viscosa TUFC12733]
MTLRGGEGLPYSEAADRLRHSTANLPQIAQYPPVYTFALPNTATANTLIATAGSSRAPPSPTTSRSPRKSGRKPGGKNPPGHRAGGARPGAGRPRKSVASGARSSPDPSEEDDAGVAAPAVMRPLPGAQAAERMIPISSLHPAYVPFMNHPHDQGLIVLPVQAVLSMAHAYTPQAMMPFPYAFGYPPPMAGVHPAMAHHAVVNGAQHPAVHAVVSQAAVTTAEAPTTASSTPSPSTPARNADGPPSRKRRRTEPLPPPGPSSAFVEGSDRQRRKARTCRICIKAGHPETSHSCPGRGSRVLCPYNPDNQNANTEQDDDQDADGEVVPADEMDDLDPDLQDEAAVNALTFPTAQTTSVASTSSTVPPSAYGYPQPVHMLGPNGQPHPLYQTTYPFAFQGAYPAPARMANMPGQPPGAVQMIQGQVPVAGSVVYVASTPQRERASKRGPRHCVVCNLTGHPEEGATCPGRGSRRLCQYYVPEQHANHDDTSIEGQLGGQMDSLLQQS